MPHVHEKIDFTSEVFIDYKNKVLLRKHEKYGIWHSVGGHVELDEDPNQAALREVKEEVNLEIEKPEYLLDLTFIRPDGIPVVVLSYYAKHKSGEVKIDADSIDYKWVTPLEAKKIDLIEGIAEEIEMVDTIINAK